MSALARTSRYNISFGQSFPPNWLAVGSSGREKLPSRWMTALLSHRRSVARPSLTAENDRLVTRMKSGTAQRPSIDNTVPATSQSSCSKMSADGRYLLHTRSGSGIKCLNVSIHAHFSCVLRSPVTAIVPTHLSLRRPKSPCSGVQLSLTSV